MLPILTKIGPLPVYAFGFFLALGFVISSFLIYRQAKKEYLDEEKVFDSVFASLIFAFLGARFIYIIEHFESFGFSPLKWLLINAKPGLSLWGGIGIGLSVFLFRIRKEKLPYFKMLDLITIPLNVSFMFGYISAFLAGNHIGTPTSLPWGVIFFSTVKRHPVGFYEFISAVITLIIMIYLQRLFIKKRNPSGSLFFSFMIIQSILLFLIAFFREDVIVIAKVFKTDHFIYFGTLISGSILLYRRNGRKIKSDLLLFKSNILNKFMVKKNEKIS